MQAVDRLLKTALAEEGYIEKKTNTQLQSKTANAGDKNWTKYAQFLDNLKVYNGTKNGYPWCDVFVDWCFITTFGLDIGMKMLNQKMAGLGAGCTGSANYFKSAGRFYKSMPTVGDQIFFTNNGGTSYNHTGIVTKVSASKVYTIEGNTSSAAGVVDNGGVVRRKEYALNYSKIGGYGRPDWSLVKEESKEMTQDAFNKMFRVAMSAYRAELQEQKVSNWAEHDIKWAVQTGLVQGNGSIDKPNYMPQDLITREQSISLLHRLYNMIKAGK